MGGGCGVTLTEPHLTLTLGSGHFWASGDDVAEVAVGRTVAAAAVTMGRSGLMSDFISRKLYSSTSHLMSSSGSEALLSSIHSGVRGRCASRAQDGREGVTNGGALQYASWSTPPIFAENFDMKKTLVYPTELSCGILSKRDSGLSVTLV